MLYSFSFVTRNFKRLSNLMNVLHISFVQGIFMISCLLTKLLFFELLSYITKKLILQVCLLFCFLLTCHWWRFPSRQRKREFGTITHPHIHIFILVYCLVKHIWPLHTSGTCYDNKIRTTSSMSMYIYTHRPDIVLFVK